MTVEDLLGFVVVILGIVSMISKNKKKQQQAAGRKAARQAQAAKPQTNRAPYSMESLQAWFEENEEDAEAKKSAVPAEPAVAASTGSIKEQTHEGMHPCDVHEDAPAQVAQPRIQARVQVTDKPKVVLGSMGTDTHEGIHPCDEHEDELLQSNKPLMPMPVEKPGIQLDWTGENMVKAFIMQEVLTRPCQRRRA